jgi:hypothetical protein
VKASEIDREQAQDKSDRTLLETIYAGLITADPTPLNKTPAPGLIEQVATIQTQLEAVKVEQQTVANNLAEHREAVGNALAADQHEVKTLLEQHIAADERNFAEILAAVKANGNGNGKT